jgi:subtilisin family serine protease
MDILIWAATDDAEAARRIAQVTTVLEAQKATITATDRRARSPVIRTILDGPTARLIANIAVVELMRPPLLPYIDPSDWRDISPDELAGEHNGGVPIGVLDDAIATGHPLLGTLVSAARSFPSGHPWQQPGPHGTMVAGLALYGDLETRLRDHLSFDSSGSVVQGRVIEPRPTQPHLRWRSSPR